MNIKVYALSLAFFGVTKGLENLALMKPSSMSVTPNPDTGSEHAVDGDVITESSANQYCTFGGDEGPSWWQVDLQQTVWISHVIVTPASYMYGRPKDFKLLVMPDLKCSSAPQTCLDYIGTLPPVSSTLNCTQPLRGRTVRFQQIGAFFLCEVEVFQFVSSDPENSSKYFTESAGRRREISYPLEHEVKSALDCGRACVRKGWSYFNYKQQDGLCQLPSVSNHSDVITSDTEWDYYEEDICIS